MKHNGAAFLQQCLASLAAQTFGDFACFVVDDGSTDESAELAAAWESRDARFVVIHQRQSGVAAARAAGVRAGLNLNARWFAFCDADDCYHKQFLDALYRAAQTTRCQIACCRYDCFTEDIPPESPPPSQTTVFQPPAHLDALLHGLALRHLPRQAGTAQKNIRSTPLFSIKDIRKDLQL